MTQKFMSGFLRISTRSMASLNKHDSCYVRGLRGPRERIDPLILLGCAVARGCRGPYGSGFFPEL